MTHPAQNTTADQLEIFKSRGMILKDETYKKNINSIENIGYYKLKEFAQPFLNKETQLYENIDLDSVIRRYWQDKNLRIYILHVIENIEVSINTEIAHTLGLKYGPFGYLNFNSWCNRNISKFVVEKDQLFFKKELLKQVSKSRNKIYDYSIDDNFDPDGFPTVWLMPSMMMFGNTKKIFSLMSPENSRIISAKYNAKPKELKSWLDALHMVRNICCHNSNIVDLSLTTKPMIPNGFDQYIYHFEQKGKIIYSNKLSLIIAILIKLMNSINPKYKFEDMFKSINSICSHDDILAHKLGFSSYDSITSMFNTRIKTRRSLSQDLSRQFIRKYATISDLNNLEKLIKNKRKKIKSN
ncbi:Abi family protein [Latilactobacillus curvatus]